MPKARKRVVVRVEDGRDASAVALSAFEYVRAPQLASAVFSAVGSKLVVSLDVPANPEVSCAFLHVVLVCASCLHALLMCESTLSRRTSRQWRSRAMQTTSFDLSP
eukprot:1567882-Rhodomonas_salina.1